MVDELALTGNARGGRSLPVGFHATTASAELFDGRYQRPRYNAYDSIRIDFDEPVLVTRVSIIYQLEAAEAQRGGQTVVAEVLSSGTETGRSGPVPLNQGCEFHPLLDAGDNLVWAREAVCSFGPPAPGQSVVLRLAKPTVAIGDIVVWGLPARLAGLSGRPGAPVRFTAAESTHSCIRVAWEQPPPGTAYVRVRYRKKGAPDWSAVCHGPAPGRAVLLSLEPDSAYEAAAEAVGPPAGKPPRAVVVRLPGAIAVRTTADVFGMNFFPGGGAGYRMHPDESANSQAMLGLMSEAGVRHARWWINSLGSMQLFAEHGIALLPSAHNPRPSRHGAWLWHTLNEPDFCNVFPEELAAQIQAQRRTSDADDPRVLLAAPEVGGDLIGPGSDYLRDLYRAGARDLFQVLSVHPYMKKSCETPRGGTPGCPEALVSSIGALREAMRDFGDGAKPIIATECGGHGPYRGTSPLPAVSAALQPAWVVRSHLLMIALGLARIYYYPFQDEGTNPEEITHTTGLVDWHGKPKPAYRAYRYMTRLVGPARCAGFVAGAESPVYAVQFDRPRGGVATALWDCGGTSRVAIAPGAGIRGVRTLAGARAPLPEAGAGRLTLTLSEQPVWVLSDRPLGILSQDRVSPKIQPALRWRLEPSSVRLLPGGEARITAVAEHDFPEPQRLILEVQPPWAPTEHVRASAVAKPGRRTEVSLVLTCPPGAERGKLYSWGAICRYGPQGTDPSGELVRHLYVMVPREPGGQ